MALAITANAQLNWGVKAGLNVSSIRGLEEYADDEESQKYSNKTGFHVGLAMQYMFSPQIGIESGLYYANLGAKGKYEDSYYEESSKETYNPSYLQLPVSVLYKFNVGQDLYLYPSLGLYAGYGIGGKVTWKYSDGDESKENFFDKDNDVNRFDMGVTAGFNLQYSKFTFGIGYDYGFLKINKEALYDGDDLFNGNAKVSVGYFF
jgi:hypothetical protein